MEGFDVHCTVNISCHLLRSEIQLTVTCIFQWRAKKVIWEQNYFSWIQEIGGDWELLISFEIQEKMLPQCRSHTIVLSYDMAEYSIWLCVLLLLIFENGNRAALRRTGFQAKSKSDGFFSLFTSANIHLPHAQGYFHTTDKERLY